VREYAYHLLSREEYSFTLEEVLACVTKNPEAVRRELSHLVEKRDILNLRQGFYLIITPRYAAFEKLPIELYAEKLFRYLERRYYLALFSAARLHGASHQQTHRDYLIIEAPKLIPIRKKNIDIQFYTTQKWPQANIETRSSDAGNYLVSSPALTFVDLIHHHRKIGGLNRVFTVLEELVEELSQADMTDLLQWYRVKSTLQRAGFLLDQFSEGHSLADMIYETLRSSSFYPVMLSNRMNEGPGSTSNRWKVDVNVHLESDL